MTEHKLAFKSDEISEDQVVDGKVGDVNLAVIKHNGEISILDGKCTHEGGPLYDGHIDNNELICPWHSGAFDVSTGKANENTPWVTDVRMYKSRIDDEGSILVEM